MKRILVLDDDPITQKIVLSGLSNAYDILACKTLSEARECIKKFDISLFLLDRVLPDGDGIEICKLIREDDMLKDKPVIFLSGFNKENEIVFSFVSGCDDYVTKPFSVLELKLRIDARLKSSHRKIFAFGLEVDLDSQTVKYVKDDTNEKIVLTPVEFKILVVMLDNKDIVLSRDTIITKVWGYGTNVTDRVIDTHISHLRKKLSVSNIEFASIRGEGYKLVS